MRINIILFYLFGEKLENDRFKNPFAYCFFVYFISSGGKKKNFSQMSSYYWEGAHQACNHGLTGESQSQLSYKFGIAAWLRAHGHGSTANFLFLFLNYFFPLSEFLSFFSSKRLRIFHVFYVFIKFSIERNSLKLVSCLYVFILLFL